MNTPVRAAVWLGAALALGGATPSAGAVAADAFDVVVRETAGIRRFNLPVSAAAKFAAGQLLHVTQLRLLQANVEIPLQATAESRWPDGSLRKVALNFNASLGPLEELRLTLEFGDSVVAAPIVKERLEVERTADGWQVGKVRFGQDPSTLLQSVTYGRENLAPGSNGFFATGTDGVVYPFAGPAKVDVLRAGPLYVRLGYRGTLRIKPGEALPYELLVDVPNSKSWVRLSLSLDDPRQRVRSLSLKTTLALRDFPWTWDFGTGSWTYGVLRSSEDSAVLVQRVTEQGTKGWEILAGRKGVEVLYERAAGQRAPNAEGWGHVLDRDRSVAFVLDRFAADPGLYRIALDGRGALEFDVEKAGPKSRHELTVYQHYVQSPTPVGAATSPVSMATPLEVSVTGRLPK